MSTFEIQHFKNKEIAEAYMQGVKDTMLIAAGLKPGPKPTNFEKITASPEALAEIIYKFKFNSTTLGDCIFNNGKNDCYSNYCDECITAWLKQEAEEDKK